MFKSAVPNPVFDYFLMLPYIIGLPFLILISKSLLILLLKLTMLMLKIAVIKKMMIIITIMTFNNNIRISTKSIIIITSICILIVMNTNKRSNHPVNTTKARWMATQTKTNEQKGETKEHKQINTSDQCARKERGGTAHQKRVNRMGRSTYHNNEEQGRGISQDTNWNKKP